jgi:hypothetical protein
MPVGCQRGDAPARCALQVALLDEIGFNHVFNGFALFANAGGNVVQPHRSTVKAQDHRFEQLAVHDVKALWVHIQHGQGAVGNIQADMPRAFHIA